jgi:hypothetical protein
MSLVNLFSYYNIDIINSRAIILKIIINMKLDEILSHYISQVPRFNELEGKAQTGEHILAMYKQRYQHLDIDSYNQDRFDKVINRVSKNQVTYLKLGIV